MDDSAMDLSYSHAGPGEAPGTAMVAATPTDDPLECIRGKSIYYFEGKIYAGRTIYDHHTSFASCEVFFHSGVASLGEQRHIPATSRVLSLNCTDDRFALSGLYEIKSRTFRKPIKFSSLRSRGTIVYAQDAQALYLNRAFSCNRNICYPFIKEGGTFVLNGSSRTTYLSFTDTSLSDKKLPLCRFVCAPEDVDDPDMQAFLRTLMQT